MPGLSAGKSARHRGKQEGQESLTDFICEGISCPAGPVLRV
jgi:hypothetical protein